MAKIKLQFFRELDDGSTRVGHAYVEEVNDREEAKDKFLRDVRESGVANESDFTFD